MRTELSGKRRVTHSLPTSIERIRIRSRRVWTSAWMDDVASFYRLVVGVSNERRARDEPTENKRTKWKREQCGDHSRKEEREICTYYSSIQKENISLQSLHFIVFFYYINNTNCIFYFTLGSWHNNKIVSIANILQQLLFALIMSLGLRLPIYLLCGTYRLVIRNWIGLFKVEAQ